MAMAKMTKIAKTINKAIVTGLGTGYLPIAPGTWGSGAISLIFLAVAWGSGGLAVCINGSLAVLCVLSAIGCVALGKFTERTFGKKDPSQCTIDEWAGQSLTYFLLPLGSNDWKAWLCVAAVGFFAFRLADIFKPPPARQIEKLPLGWGVLLDDLVAGIYANIACQLLLRYWLLDLL